MKVISSDGDRVLVGLGGGGRWFGGGGEEEVVEEKLARGDPRYLEAEMRDALHKFDRTNRLRRNAEAMAAPTTAPARPTRTQAVSRCT